MVEEEQSDSCLSKMQKLKVETKGERVRCKKCQSVIDIRAAREKMESEGEAAFSETARRSEEAKSEVAIVACTPGEKEAARAPNFISGLDNLKI